MGTALQKVAWVLGALIVGMLLGAVAFPAGRVCPVADGRGAERDRRAGRVAALHPDRGFDG